VRPVDAIRIAIIKQGLCVILPVLILGPGPSPDFCLTSRVTFSGVEAVRISIWWIVGHAQSTGIVPSTLGLWTMGNPANFIIYSVLWELLLVGVPVAVAAIVAWIWWRSLPHEERMGYYWGKRSRSAGGSGGIGFLFFVAFPIKVYVDGNWNTPISTFTLNYVVGSMITILEWVAVIFGIPIAIGGAWVGAARTEEAEF